MGNLLFIAKLGNNNIKNVNIEYKFIKLNYIYHLRISFKDEANLRLKSQFANKLASKLRKLMIIWQQNLFST